MRALPSHTTIKVARAGCRIDRERERERERKRKKEIEMEKHGKKMCGRDKQTLESG